MILTHGLLFLAPFIGYAIWLYIGNKARKDKRFRDGPIAWLTISGLALVILSFSLLAYFSNSPEGSQYQPAQVIDGKFVPGGYK
ncbi:hypothetical protein E1162_17275 [Rhodobacteraceae bacterium RKSG542]|nr:hypothetical protein [Pseudovibrio flavus]